MKFSHYVKLQESVKIVHIDPEDERELSTQAYQIAQKVGIRPDRSKSPTIVALNGDDIVGAVFTSWENDHDMSAEAGEPYAQYAFDVVVKPEWQGREMVGMKLIKQAEDERQHLEAAYDQKAYTRLYVVNPKLSKILQYKHGYEVGSEHKDSGSTILYKY